MGMNFGIILANQVSGEKGDGERKLSSICNENNIVKLAKLNDSFDTELFARLVYFTKNF